MALSIEVLGPNNDEVVICGDREGIDSLIHLIQFLGKTDHVHLMSDSWGGHDLLEKVWYPNGKSVHHLRICLVSPSEFAD
jgi:hypothetical protein